MPHQMPRPAFLSARRIKTHPPKIRRYSAFSKIVQEFREFFRNSHEGGLIRLKEMASLYATMGNNARRKTTTIFYERVKP
jgi:hypothetical protein